VTAPDRSFLVVRATGKEHSNVVGTATVRVFDLAALQPRPDCAAIVKTLAEADADYAAGRGDRERPLDSRDRERTRCVLTGQRRISVRRACTRAPADRALRGQTALALAGVEYFDLQDWAKTAEWAKAAAELLGNEDPYRRARADALLAAAWIEIGSAAPAGRAVPGYGVRSSELLARARTELQRLSRFHMQRGERYDAGGSSRTLR